jgi:hypothetical protein
MSYDAIIVTTTITITTRVSNSVVVHCSTVVCSITIIIISLADWQQRLPTKEKEATLRKSPLSETRVRG